MIITGSWTTALSAWRWRKALDGSPPCIYQGQETLSRASEGWEQYPGAAATVNGLTGTRSRLTRRKTAANAPRFPSKALRAAKFSSATAASVGGGTTCDLEVRYTLGKGDSGFYTYQIFNHPANYPGTTPGGESRYINQLSNNFNWLSVDADRNMAMISGQDSRTGVVVHAKEQRILSAGIYQNSVEHKYSYCARMYELRRTVGRASTTTSASGSSTPRMNMLAAAQRNWTSSATWARRCSITGCRATTPAACSATFRKARNGARSSARFTATAMCCKTPATTTQAELDTLAATAGNPTLLGIVDSQCKRAV